MPDGPATNALQLELESLLAETASQMTSCSHLTSRL